MDLNNYQIKDIILTLTEVIFTNNIPHKQTKVTVTDNRKEPDPFINVYIEITPAKGDILLKTLRLLKLKYNGHIVVESYDLPSEDKTVYDIDIFPIYDIDNF